MRKSVLVVVICATVLVGAIPAYADKPFYDSNFPTFQLHFIDGENKVAFWNIHRDVYCDWAEDEPQIGDPVVIENVTLMMHEGGANGFARYSETRPLEIWELTSDDPCAGTASALGPWAIGDAHASLQDYEPAFGGGQPFGFTFGIQGQGTVYDDSGQAWFHSWRFRQFDTSGDQELGTASFTLKPIGR